MLVRTSCDGLMKPTYVLLKKERTNLLRLIVRTFLMTLAQKDQKLLHVYVRVDVEIDADPNFINFTNTSMNIAF